MAVDRSTPILVVDDSAAIVRIIRSLLKQLGFGDIDEAEDGATALTKMRGKRYGLVISDWNMSKMSGYDFLREVRSDSSLKRTAFIMVTGEYKPENVIAAKRAGVSNYIVKPFDASILGAKIEATFAVRAAASG
jgi:two-component system chemotaxis response regulator CheY